jgi:hypothetical protein
VGGNHPLPEFNEGLKIVSFRAQAIYAPWVEIFRWRNGIAAR